MSRHPLLKILFSAWLMLVVMTASLGSGTAYPVKAQVPNPTGNPVVGLLNLISAGNRRARVYRSARVTQKEMDAYYDSLIAQARRQLQNRELQSANQSQLRVYIKLNAALVAERAAVTQQIEAEKKQAHRNFNRSLNHEVTQFVVRAPGAQRILSDARQVVNGLKENIVTLRAALSRGEVIDSLLDQLTSRIINIPYLQSEVRNLGGALGDDIDQALGGLLRRSANAARGGQEEMRQALAEAERLDAAIAGYQNQKRTPVSLVEEGSLIKNMRSVRRANAAYDTAVEALVNGIAARNLLVGSGLTVDQLRTRIRNQMLQQRLTNLQNASQQTILISCTSVTRDEYQLAAFELGQTPENPADPSSARYLVCGDRVNGTVIYAALIGRVKEGDRGQTPSPTPPNPADESSPELETEADVQPTDKPSRAPEQEPEPEPNPQPETAGIPTGTYEGVTSASRSFLPNDGFDYYPAGTPVFVRIDENGIVSGTASVEPTELNYPDCGGYIYSDLNGTFSGKVKRADNRFEILVTWRDYANMPPACDAAFNEDISGQMNGYVIFTIEDGVMYGKVYNATNDILYFSFEARRR